MTQKRPSSKAKAKAKAKEIRNPKPETRNKKPGRPAAFNPQFIDRASALYRQGAIDEEVAKALGVALSTLYKWKAEISEFSEAVKAARDVVTDKVEAALFKRAIGCMVPSIHFSTFEGKVTQTPFVEYFPPDTGAALGWLKANRPEKYRDVTRMEHSGKVAHSANIEDMSADELAAAKERLEKLEAANA